MTACVLVEPFWPWRQRPGNAAHDRQHVTSTYRSGLYCVDEKARLRWRVSRHPEFRPDCVALAPRVGKGTITMIGGPCVVCWP